MYGSPQVVFVIGYREGDAEPNSNGRAIGVEVALEN
jgi:hypothetical protein